MNQIKRTTYMIPLKKIEPDPEQPRRFITEISVRDLSLSIKASGGVEQPIKVYLDGDIYRIIYGERRYTAAKLAGLREIEAIVVEKPDELEKRISQLKENRDAKSLNPLDEADALDALVSAFEKAGYEKPVEEAAKSQGLSLASMSKKRVPAKIDERLKDMYRRGLLDGWTTASQLQKLLKDGKIGKFNRALELLEAGEFVAKDFFKRGYKWQKVTEETAEEKPEPKVAVKKIYWRGAIETSELVSIIKATGFAEILDEQHPGWRSLPDANIKDLWNQFREWLSASVNKAG